MIPGIYNFIPQTRTNTFDAIEFELTDINDDPIDITGTDISMAIKCSADDTTSIKTLTSGAEIDISDPTNGKFIIKDDWEISIPKGTYVYDIKITFPSGKVKTYIKGKIEVPQNIS
jgi:hypothetical protein